MKGLATSNRGHNKRYLLDSYEKSFTDAFINAAGKIHQYISYGLLHFFQCAHTFIYKVPHFCLTYGYICADEHIESVRIS